MAVTWGVLLPEEKVRVEIFFGTSSGGTHFREVEKKEGARR
jgi:hypothetical protein